MKCILLSLLFWVILLPADAQSNHPNDFLRQKILSDSRLDTVQNRALKLLAGFAAGTSYSEVWVRDFNTFINGSLRAHPKEKVKEKLLMFFKMQGHDGNIPDGIVDSATANGGYQYRYSALLPGWAAHKNTVETDQESSLIQAVKKYVDYTHDSSILAEKVGGITVVRRMEMALEYIFHNRWSYRYGLVTGATTIDWGDVQPETGWGVAINKKTKWAIDIYDNAMYSKAIKDFLSIKPADYYELENWRVIAQQIKVNARNHLWDEKLQKYIPHLYVDGTPFPPGFNEQSILYTGGTICATLAGFNTPAEIEEINHQLLTAAKSEKFATIGITVYPPYPEMAYPNMKPFTYQNGGDWTWFGGRMVEVLINNGQPKEAYEELIPMIERVITNNGFYEWYDVQTGEPKGSGDFRGEAGVLFDAINMLKNWAAQINRLGKPLPTKQ